MSDAPTPEVDNFATNFPDAPVSGWQRLARRLERERDQSRKSLEVSRDIVKNQREYIAQLKASHAELIESAENLLVGKTTRALAEPVIAHAKTLQ